MTIKAAIAPRSCIGGEVMPNTRPIRDGRRFSMIAFVLAIHLSIVVAVRAVHVVM